VTKGNGKLKTYLPQLFQDTMEDRVVDIGTDGLL
jgi:hypothetical protein